MYMLLEGAEGETREQIENYLGTNVEENREHYNMIVNRIEGSGSGFLSSLFADPVLSVANGFWYDSIYESLISDEYIDNVGAFYNTKVSALDFSDSEKAAETINSWCSNNTSGKIPEIVLPDDISDTFSVICNYFFCCILYNRLVFNKGNESNKRFYKNRSKYYK